jgi:hypothetical protein
VTGKQADRQRELDQHVCVYRDVRGMGKCAGHNSLIQVTEDGQPVGPYQHVCAEHQRIIEEGWDGTGRVF